MKNLLNEQSDHPASDGRFFYQALERLRYSVAVESLTFGEHWISHL